MSPHKYHAVRTVVDGVSFASKAEARRYSELRLLEKAGEIWELELQPSFPLHTASTTGQLGEALKAVAGTRNTLVGHYRGDFRYQDRRRGKAVVEDVKGMDTPMSKWKRRHVALQYGVLVEVVK